MAWHSWHEGCRRARNCPFTECRSPFTTAQKCFRWCRKRFCPSLLRRTRRRIMRSKRCSGLAHLEKSWSVRPSRMKLVSLTDSVTQRATWHVERRQTGSPSTSPIATPALKRPSLPPSRAGSTDSVSQLVTLDVALKAIPKKKVKGDEESVFSEMRVLQGLDHPNIVRPPLFPSHR